MDESSDHEKSFMQDVVRVTVFSTSNPVLQVYVKTVPVVNVVSVVSIAPFEIAEEDGNGQTIFNKYN